MSATNETTKQILQYLFDQRVFAWRQNTVGIPTERGWRTAAKTGVADILAVLPKNGRLLAVEVKTGRDTLRPEQLGFGRNIEAMGGVYLVVKDFPDFLDKWNSIPL